MKFFEYSLANIDKITTALGQTLYMLLISAIFVGVFGLIIGVILVVTNKGGVLENKKLYNILDKITNLFRAIPFIILVAFIAPLTKFIVNARIGTTAAIVPLVFSATPFFAKQVEQALAEIDKGIIEASLAMGNSPVEIITSVYLREGLPSIIRASSITLISLLGLTTMAGMIGGGGIGNLAIAVGYNRYKDDIVIISVFIILIMVYIIQAIANYLIRKTSH